MTHIGTLDTLRLATLLQRIEMHRKTGCVLIEHDDTRDEIYVYQGQVIAVLSTQTRRPLLRRLLEAGEISVRQLRTLPAETGRVLSQVEKENLYSDKQVASELLQHGLIEREALISWQQRETEQELQKLMQYTEGHVSFEERNNVPDMLIDRSTDSITLAETIDQEITSKSLSIGNETRTTAETGQKSAAAIDTKALATTRTALQAIPVIIQHTFPHRSVSSAHDMHTARVAVPPKPNPFLQWETLLVLAILLIAGLAHGINMFHYPYFEDDEGTYLSQAWAVLHLGRLAYYTYWYDHAPAGWIQLAGWLAITGGFRTFGSAMNSGRVFMLVLQLGSTFVLYRIARIISKSWVIATIVVLLFALSPYGLYYHRRILLDNIMTFWMLLSILFLLSKKMSLKNVWFSAISLAISVLSKEVAAFIIPTLAYFVWVRTDKSHRAIAFTSWTILVLAILSIYPLMALLKGELFPSGTLLGGNNPHVSLIGSLSYQGSRGDGSSIFTFHSYFWGSFTTWAHDDPILVIGGSLSAILSLFLIKKHRLIGIVGLTTLSLWAFLARGGVVFDFYLIPLLPMLALNFGLILGLTSRYVQNYFAVALQLQKRLGSLVQPTLVIVCVIVLLAIIPSPSAGVGYGASNVGSKNNPLIYWNSTQTNDQIAATNWVEHHISTNSHIVIDMYMWPELYTKGYKYAHYYWKVDEDPAIRDGVFHDNWRNIDYIITTPEMIQDVNNNNMQILNTPIHHSIMVAKFNSGGWSIDILKVDK